jgi:hypothetical protein
MGAHAVRRRHRAAADAIAKGIRRVPLFGDTKNCPAG